MTLAFKEWSYIVDALGRGMQNLIIRKGGIHEDEFIIKGKKFLLFPTLYHQAPSMIKEKWLRKLNGEAYNHPDNTVTINYFAEIVDTKLISDKEVLSKLDYYHAWKEEVVNERFDRGEKKVHLLIVQVYKLAEPFKVEQLPEYGGCKSWIEMNEDVNMEGELVINPLFK